MSLEFLRTGRIAAVSILALAACFTVAGWAQTQPIGSQSNMGTIGNQFRPKLAVVITVDQMRADYLHLYDQYFEHGLRRLLDEGAVFENAWVDHGLTNSLPGHTTVITGTYPRTHGVVDNVWHQPADGPDIVRSGYNLVDRTDGAPYELGARTLPEWFLSADPEAKFAAIGSNGATRMYAGRLRGPVYWQDPAQGYMTNDNYSEAVPDWVVTFNENRLTELNGLTWTSSVPESLRSRLRPDASSFENGGNDTAFPHEPSENPERRFDWLYNTPFADRATLELAATAIGELELGSDEVPDILALSLNSLDQIGHAFGPFSHEQTDALLQLDSALGDFFDALDEQVGEGQWVVVLSADHGVNTTPEQRRLWGSVEGRRINQQIAQEVVDRANEAAAAIEDPSMASRAAATAIAGFDFVEAVFTEADVAEFQAGTDSIQGLLALSYVPGRIPAHPFYIRENALAELGVYVVLKEDIMMDWATAIHGSQYDYDRRVPIIVLGGRVAAGRIAQRAATVDIAPTVLDLVGIEPPAAMDGTTLLSRLSLR